jgi:hypothetical protein
MASLALPLLSLRTKQIIGNCLAPAKKGMPSKPQGIRLVPNVLSGKKAAFARVAEQSQKMIPGPTIPA